MKNLKKILALVLAFACAFTMFAGAAFTDQADINADNADAVELLTTLNIISGYPDGTFDPEGTVDRAEMAKMIYTIRNGGNDDASAHVDNTTSFTDINGHWAEGYIKYLQNTGIVAGKSATTFDPDSPVTTTEAMKMALALAGYDEKNAELTGPNWSKNTLTLATTIGLTDNVSSAMNAGCTRQDAAQILANVLEATAVRYSAIVENFVNDSKTGLSYGGDPITVGYKWMDLTIYVGKMVSSGAMSIDGASAAGKDRFAIAVDTVNGVEWDRWNWDNILDWIRGNRLTVEDGQDHTDLVGEEVKVLTGEKIDEVYGVYATGTSNVVETTMSEVSFDDDGLKIDGVVYDCDHNDTDVTSVYADNDGAATVNAVFTDGDDIQKVADRVKMIDWNDDDVYETIIVKTVNVAKVSSVTSKSVSLGPVGNRDNAETQLRNNASLDFDDNTIYEGVAKGDYAIVTRNLYNNDWVVEKADIVEGTVNGKVDNERRVRVDGEWYTLANKNDATPGELLTITGSRSNFENDDQITMVVVDGIVYYAASTTGNDANRSVLMVYDTNWFGSEWEDTRQAKVILADGTKKTVDLDGIYDENGNAVEMTRNGKKINGIDIGRMYRYEVDNDGDYTLFTLAMTNDETDRVGYEGVDNNIAGIVDNRVDEMAIADEAVVFALINNGDGTFDAEVYTGKTIKDADVNDGWGNTAVGQYLYESENGFTYARMLNVEIDEELDTTTAYGYLTTDATRTRINGVNYMEYNFFDGEDNVFAMEKTDADRRSYAKEGSVISFAYVGGTIARAETEDGSAVEIKDVKVNDGLVYAAMTGANSSSVQFRTEDWGRVTADMTDDTKIIYVDSHADEPEEIGQTDKEGYDYVVGLNPDNNTYPINVAYILDNNDNEVKLLVIDVENDMKGQNGVDENATGILTIDGDVADIAKAISETTKAKVEFDIDTVTIDGELDIPSYTTIDWSGVETINLGDKAEIKGNVTLPFVSSVENGAKVIGTLTVADPTESKLTNLAGQNGAKIVLSKDYTAEDGDKFYADKDTQIIEDAIVPAGTYTWNSTAGNKAGGWVASKVESMEVENIAELENALKMSNNVTVTEDVELSDDLPIGENKTVTFEGTVDLDSHKLIIAAKATANFKDVTIDDAKAQLVVNGTANVAGTVNTSDNTDALTGAGTLNVTKAQTAENICRVDGTGLTLNMGAATTTDSTNNRWVIGAYEVADGALVKVPAGQYKSENGKWVLKSISDSKIEAGEIANEAMMSALFSVTSRVEATTVAGDEHVNVTDGKTLALSGNPDVGARVHIAAKGVVELNGDEAWSLDRVIGEGKGATVKFSSDLGGNVSYGSSNVKFYVGGVPTTIGNSLAGRTFAYELDAGGSGVPGFVAQ